MTSSFLLFLQAMRAGEDYDYFYEVDGERRYDFDCDFSSVEVREASPMMTKMCAGQFIIANSIQIDEKDDSGDGDSFTDAFNAANNSNNSEIEWQVSGPAVCWPSHLVKLVMHLKPAKDTMVLTTTTTTTMTRDVVSSSSQLSSSGAYSTLLDSYRYCASASSYQQPQPKQQAQGKRVHFWDCDSVVVQKQASF